MEDEQRNGHAPLDRTDLENSSSPQHGLNSNNGHTNGNGVVSTHGRSASGGKAAVNGHAASNGSYLLGGQSSGHPSANGQSLDRKLEYVDRSVGAGFAGHGAVDETELEDDAPTNGKVVRKSDAAKKTRPIQQVGEARRRQGLSIRCVAQRLGMTVGEVRAQEESEADMMLSELYRWQSVLDVPLEELLADPQDALSPRVLMRARMLRVMKTARALRAQARSESEHRLAKVLIGQLIEIMPELKEVAAWPTVGHRRTADEVGRIGERPIPDDFMHEAS